MLAERLVDDALDVLLVRDVRLLRHAFLDVDADDRCALLAELVGDSLADALRGAGDDRDPVVELPHCSLLELVEVRRVLVALPRLHVV